MKSNTVALSAATVIIIEDCIMASSGQLAQEEHARRLSEETTVTTEFYERDRRFLTTPQMQGRNMARDSDTTSVNNKVE